MDRRSFLQSLALIGLTEGTTYWLNRPKPVKHRGIYVQMGSSITAGLHGPGAYLTPVIVGSRLNLTPINVGFDGGYAGTLNSPNTDELSLCWLVDAIISGDWSAQERAIAARDPVDATILSRIRAIDFSKVTHVALEYGVNDFTLAAPIGKNTDETKDTFKGSLNYAI